VKVLALTVLLAVAGALSGAEVTLAADRMSAAVGEMVTVTLSAVEGSGETITEVREPSFDGFEIEHRGESSSSSISIVNGKISSRKEQTYTYVLRSVRPGVYTVGPAVAVLKKGSEVKSNVLRITVIGGGAAPAIPTPQPPGTGTAPGEGASGGGESGLFAPLSAWERQTARCFVRVVVSPDRPLHQGEPLIVSYYLFTQKNLISDLSFYRLPSFENAWSEEIASPKKLTFSRTNIGGVVYDYALLKQYLLVPSPKAQRLAATQMILDSVTGGFFDMRKRSLSSIALDLALEPLPDAGRHPGGIVGDFTISQKRTTLSLDAQKPLDTIAYTAEGCGNLQNLEMSLPDTPGLKIFAPDVKEERRIEGGRLCGAKTFSFMVKGQSAGTATLPAPSFDCWDREKGWRTVAGKPVVVTVSGVTTDEPNTVEKKKKVRYELLRELPAGVVVHDLSPLTERRWFRAFLLVPVVLLLLTLGALLVRALLSGRRARRAFVVRQWEERIAAAGDPSALLNAYYDAVTALSGVGVRGARKGELEKRFPGRAEALLALASDIQAAAYGGGGDLGALKTRAGEMIRLIGGGR